MSRLPASEPSWWLSDLSLTAVWEEGDVWTPSGRRRHIVTELQRESAEAEAGGERDSGREKDKPAPETLAWAVPAAVGLRFGEI